MDIKIIERVNAQYRVVIREVATGKSLCFSLTNGDSLESLRNKIINCFRANKTETT
jgi:hypothetical protein